MKPAAPVPHLTHPANLRRARSRFASAIEGAIAALTAPFLVLAAFAALIASRLAASSVGVEFTKGVRPGATTLQRHPTATYFVAGVTERGSVTEPIELRSMNEFQQKCGARTSTTGTIYDDLNSFFSTLSSWGLGGRVVLVRTVGAGATVGTLTLKDRSSGAGLSTLRIDARDPGGASGQFTVEIQDGTLANTFRVLLRLNGDLVKVYNDVASPSALAAAAANDPYIVATNLGSATAAPNNNPRVLAATPLSAGNDDLGTIDAAAHVAALARITPEFGGGIVAIPGQSATNVGAGLIAHAVANRRSALLTAASGTSVAAAKTEAATFRGTAGSENAGYWFQWVRFDDGAGNVRDICPAGYIAACRSRALQEVGPGQAAAGELAASSAIVGLATVITRADINDLLDDRVNAIRLVAGTVRNYGWRSLSTDEVNYLWLTATDVMNYIGHIGESKLEQFAHLRIDGKGHLFARERGVMKGVLDELVESDQLFARTSPNGDPIDPGYSIDTGPSVNTDDTIAAGESHVVVAVRVSPVGELIKLAVIKVSHDSSL